MELDVWLLRPTTHTRAVAMFALRQCGSTIPPSSHEKLKVHFPIENV